MNITICEGFANIGTFQILALWTVDLDMDAFPPLIHNICVKG